jgi:hypothetical protein
MLAMAPQRSAAQVSPAALPPRPAESAAVAPQRQDGRRHAQLIPAISPDSVRAQKRAAFLAAEKAKLLEKPVHHAWYEDPIALGTLLLMAPPIGLAALWSSKRYSTDARWALTVMTALTLCVGAAVVVAVIAMRS